MAFTDPSAAASSVLATNVSLEAMAAAGALKDPV